MNVELRTTHRGDERTVEVIYNETVVARFAYPPSEAELLDALHAVAYAANAEAAAERAKSD